jgi:hypothetical protein
MEDKLKKFVDQNREAFDELEPSAELWSRIEEKLEQKESAKRYDLSSQWIWKVAAVLFLGISLALIFDKFNPITSQMSGSDNSAYKLPEQLQQVEQYYHSRIDEGIKELAGLSQDDPELLTELTAELIKMDSLYAQLKTRLPASSNPDAVIDAMTANLQLRMDLLNNQMQLLQQFKNRRQNKDSKKSSETSAI